MAGTTRAKNGTDDKLREALDKLEEGVAEVLDSEGFRRYLSFQAKFHRYSPNNALLIFSQRPDATFVAGYKRWQELGRQVEKGEKQIRILAPVRRKVRDDETGEEGYVARGFRVVGVFDVSQTTGEPIPEAAAASLLDGSTAASSVLAEGLRAVASGWGVEVGEADAGELPVDVRGRYVHAKGGEPPRIRLAPGLASDHAAKTLVHELAHHLVPPDPSKGGRELRETEAEGTAFVVLTHLGLDASGYSFPYIANWAGDVKVLKGAMSTIQKTARTIIDAVEATADPVEAVEASGSGSRSAA